MDGGHVKGETCVMTLQGKIKNPQGIIKKCVQQR